MFSDEKNLIDELLAEQGSLTAVERFSQRHDQTTSPLQARYYRDLIPLSAPAAGQQYSFEVNLDKCTGCKACVSACHSLNGLEARETWRDVGTLVGYQRGQAYVQTITSACHHCLEPGCLEGCPVMAYDKDAVTGIVRHLDDQCIGCQYCTMKCPYEVPKYSKKLGIVRKCDMCHDRLAVGEAPACVQACPHEAITIKLIDRAEVSALAEKPGACLLPGTFDSSYTKPSTRYVSSRAIPSDAESAAARVPRREHAHWPLIVMLILTQLAVGLFLMLAGLAAWDRVEFSRLSFPVSVAGMIALHAGLVAAVFHLGRPLGAWRFFLGLRTSWMSREILAFSTLAGMSFFAVGAAWLFPGFTLPIAATAAMGLVAVFTSAMIYVDTRRSFWSKPLVFWRFYGTTVLLGAGSLAVFGSTVAAAVAIVSQFFVFAWDLSRYSDALQESDSVNHLSARIVKELMPRIIPWRSLLFALSTCAFATFLARGESLWAAAGLIAAISGSMLERYTFFTAVVPLRMPEGVTR